MRRIIRLLRSLVDTWWGVLPEEDDALLNMGASTESPTTLAEREEPQEWHYRCPSSTRYRGRQEK